MDIEEGCPAESRIVSFDVAVLKPGSRRQNEGQGSQGVCYGELSAQKQPDPFAPWPFQRMFTATFATPDPENAYKIPFEWLKTGR